MLPAKAWTGAQLFQEIQLLLDKDDAESIRSESQALLIGGGNSGLVWLKQAWVCQMAETT